MKIGDFILVREDHFASRLIRFGQSLRFHGKRKPYAQWNHVALVTSEEGHLLEALFTGVKTSHIDKYENKKIKYKLVTHDMSDEDRQEILAFADSVAEARWHYGYVTILALALTLLTGSKFVVGRVGSAICSGLVAEALVRSGEIFDRPPSYMMPADLAEHYNVT